MEWLKYCMEWLKNLIQKYPFTSLIFPTFVSIVAFPNNVMTGNLSAVVVLQIMQIVSLAIIMIALKQKKKGD